MSNQILEFNDTKLTIVRKFRWTLSSNKLRPSPLMKIKFNFVKKIIKFSALEFAVDNNFVPIHEFLDSDIVKSDFLIFSTFNGCGDILYSYKFSDLKIIKDEADFDYLSNKESRRNVELSYKHKSKIILNQDT